jgi:tetratricopeptide (TPR) repeat protein
VNGELIARLRQLAWKEVPLRADSRTLALLSIDPHYRPWALAGVIAAAVLAAYANCYDVPFTFDDQGNIADNKAIRTLILPPETMNLHYRRPVGRWSLWLNYRLHGNAVRGYHVLNVAVHLAAALVLFDLVRRTLLLPRLAGPFGADADWLAFAIALLWAVHPLQVQSVTYVIQRFESLMALFFLLTLWCLVRSHGSRVAWLWQLGAIVSCSLSIGSKEVGAMIPLVALAYDRIFLADRWRNLLLRRGWMYAGLAPALVWFLWQMTPANGRHAETAQGISSWEYFRSQPAIILHYARLAVWPDVLVLDYGWPVAHDWWTIAAPGTMLLVLLVGTFGALWLRPSLGLVGWFFFLTLAPTSSVIPISDLAFEHRMYLPLAAIAVVAVFGCYWLGKGLMPGRTNQRSYALLAGVVLVAVALGLRTHSRNNDWRDPLLLWSKNVAAAPHHCRAWGNLANAYLDRGDTAEGVRLLARAVELKPTDHWARALYGSALLKAERAEEALVQCQAAARLKPRYGPAHLGLGKSCHALRRYRQAEEHYRKTLELEPEFADAHDALARLLGELGRHEEAAKYYAAACRHDPHEPLFPTNFGTYHARRGNYDDAIAQFQEALRRKPDYAQAQLQMALAEYERGDLPAASRAAVRLLRMRPNSVAARELLKRIDERMGS